MYKSQLIKLVTGKEKRGIRAMKKKTKKLHDAGRERYTEKERTNYRKRETYCECKRDTKTNRMGKTR